MSDKRKQRAITLEEIVVAWLRSHNYDGLFRYNECACEVTDLMPCGEPCVDCEAGYRYPGRGEYDFTIGPTKLKKED